AVARFQTNGTSDVGFGGAGRVLREVTRDPIGAMTLAFQPDTRILVSTFSEVQSSRLTLSRYNPDGNLDTGFGVNGIGALPDVFRASAPPQSLALVVQNDGRIVFAAVSPDVGANTGILFLKGVNADGTLETRSRVLFDIKLDATTLAAAVQ